MARYNNNNRITPDAVQNYNLTPAASVVDKQSKYTPQLEESAKLKQTAQGLADLAKGVTALNIQAARMANDNAIAAYAKTVGEKNKKEWAKVSNNIDGMAKFNPYNKEVYKFLLAQDIGKKYTEKIFSDPELKYRDPAEIANMINNLQSDMMADFGNAGLNQKYYADSLINFTNNVSRLKQQYIPAHAEIEMQRTDNQISTTYSNYLLEGGQNKFSSVLDNVVTEGQGLGRTLEGNASNILNTVQKAVTSDPTKFSTSFILTQLKTYKINGKALSEIVPNLEGQVVKMMREVKQADLQDRKLTYETEQFDMQLKRDEIATEWIELLRSGKDLNPREQQQWAVEMGKKYGLDGINSFQLFKNLADGRQTFTDLKNIPSDPETVLDLQAGIFTGETSNLSLFEAMEDGNLSPQDAAKLGEQLRNFDLKKEAKEIKKVDEHIKRTTEEYTQNDDKSGYKAVLSTKKAKQSLINHMSALRSEYEKGEITYKQFNDKLAIVKSAVKEIERRDKEGQKLGMLSGYESLRATPEISQEQWNQVDTARSTMAIRRVGIVRNSANRASNSVYIASSPNPNRTINGKTRRHTGYDLGGRDVYMGKPVYSPSKGIVVGVLKGYNGGMGNMVLVRCENGNLIKYMHLQNTGLPSLGVKIDTDTPIGYVGNTGAVEKNSVGSLHIECYDKNMQWIPAYKLMG